MKRFLQHFLLILLITIPQTGKPASLPLNKVQSWGYLLQNVKATEIHQSPFDLVVVEPQLESDPSKTISRTMVKLMKTKPRSRNNRIVLAYLSIGEAESYRSYWKKDWKISPPSWLGKENQNWEGNFKVRYWDPEWQALILRQLEKLLVAGFDGIYLDIVDAWYYWGDRYTYDKGFEIYQPTDPREDFSRSAKTMLIWLEKLASYSQTESVNHNPSFLIFPQNGEQMIDHLSPSDKTRYWKTVDGIGVEDLFYFGKGGENNPLNIEKERLRLLRTFVKMGRQVLSVEYITRAGTNPQYESLAKKEGFIPYRGTRLLDRLILPQPSN